MKKGLKIAAAAAGIPLGLILIAGLVVPGLPAKAIVRSFCVNTDVKAEPYPYHDIKPQDGWKRITAGGMTMLVPPTLEDNSTHNPQAAESSLFSDAEGTAVLIDDPQALGELDLQSFNRDSSFLRLGLSERSVSKFAADMGKPPVTDYAGLFDLIYDMDINDCNVFSLRKASAFTSFALIKELFIPAAEKYWKYETENGSGLIMLTHTPEQDETTASPHYTYLIDLFEKQDGSIEHRVMVMAADSETCLAILNTAEIVN